VRFEDLDECRFLEPTRRNRQNQLHEFFLGERDIPIVHQKKRDRRIRAHSLVAVYERMVLAKVEKIGRCHGRNGGVQEFAAVGRLRRSNRRF
jgi:hypothetical protein